MDRLDILHLTTFLQGGAGRAIVDLACAQHEAGHGVTVVTSLTSHGEFGNYPDYLERLRGAGVSLHTCDSLFVRDLGLNLRVVDLLAELKPGLVVEDGDPKVKPGFVVHAHAAVPAFIGFQFAERLGQRIPIVQTQHGWGINKTTEQAAFDIDVLRHVDRVIATSRATARLLVDYGAPRGAMTVIPCGLPLEDGGVPSSDIGIVRALRADGSRIVGCIGSVTANKNQRLLLEALQWLEDPTITVVFIGEGSEDLAEEARELGVGDQIVTCGYQPEASRWLPLFDLLAVPSRTEGQGMVVLEAFRARVPVVASHIPAFTELIDDGRNGFVVTPLTAKALAAGIRRALALPPDVREAMVGVAREQFEREFTISRMVQRHETLYREVIGMNSAVAGPGAGREGQAN
jgi:glycosyltransferase involved in cell wall biosynthesis